MTYKIIVTLTTTIALSLPLLSIHGTYETGLINSEILGHSQPYAKKMVMDRLQANKLEFATDISQIPNEKSSILKESAQRKYYRVLISLMTDAGKFLNDLELDEFNDEVKAKIDTYLSSLKHKFNNNILQQAKGVLKSDYAQADMYALQEETIDFLSATIAIGTVVRHPVVIPKLMLDNGK